MVWISQFRKLEVPPTFVIEGPKHVTSGNPWDSKWWCQHYASDYPRYQWSPNSCNQRSVRTLTAEAWNAFLANALQPQLMLRRVNALAAGVTWREEAPVGPLTLVPLRSALFG